MATIRIARREYPQWVAVLAVLLALLILGLLIWYLARLFQPEEPLPTAVSMAPAGDLVAVGYSNGKVKIWTLPKYLPFWEGNGERVHHAAITGLDFSPDGSRIASADEAGVVLLWSTQKLKDPVWDAWQVTDEESPAYISFLQNGRLAVVTRSAVKIYGLMVVYKEDVGYILETDVTPITDRP